MTRRLLVAATLVLAAGCGKDTTNPFGALAATRPPSADAALILVGGSWSETTGNPREALALSLDGTKVERLTTCAEASTPCDFLQVAPSPDRSRIVAIRTTPGAEEGANTLYYTDLLRGVETAVFPRRRVDAVDWSNDGTFIIYSAVVAQTSEEDLFFSQPNGTAEQNLTQSPGIRETNGRIDPFNVTVVYEAINDTGASRLVLYPDTALTSGPPTGPALPGTIYLVGSDASPVFSPDATTIAFRRLTGTGNGGLGTWDLMTLRLDGSSQPRVLASGPLFRGAPDWGTRGIVYVETDAASSRSDLVLVQPDGTGRTVLRTEDAGYRMGSPRWLAGS